VSEKLGTREACEDVIQRNIANKKHVQHKRAADKSSD